MGWKGGYFGVRYAPLGVVVSGPRYGEVVEGDLATFRRGDILGFPKAELLIEAQLDIFITLHKLMVFVLSDTMPTRAMPCPIMKDSAGREMPPQATKWRELTSTCRFKDTDEIELSSSYLLPAFSLPPTLDLDHIISLANARAGAARDHLWQLQCNPAYMRRQLEQYIGSRAVTH